MRENIDNSKVISSEWCQDKDAVVLEYVVNVSGRKCEWGGKDFDSTVDSLLNENNFAANFRAAKLDAVDFKNWGRNPWHKPKDEVDAYNAARNLIENEDIMVKSAVFTEEDSFKDMQPYLEKKAEITFAVNVTKALEREAERGEER